ncbi:hypothetical protein F383_01926 [Gossypium arboreum]|uniref:Uncharacterized protein n=1 Tax=Gossypium arboreum TaxID=29729 RepID=A0A0B0Q033_GOSAR|nr:hypothetical protein F383_01926 [Gossypium arboreum]
MNNVILYMWKANMYKFEIYVYEFDSIDVLV